MVEMIRNVYSVVVTHCKLSLFSLLLVFFGPRCATAAGMDTTASSTLQGSSTGFGSSVDMTDSFAIVADSTEKKALYLQRYFYGDMGHHRCRVDHRVHWSGRFW